MPLIILVLFLTSSVIFLVSSSFAQSTDQDILYPDSQTTPKSSPDVSSDPNVVLEPPVNKEVAEPPVNQPALPEPEPSAPSSEKTIVKAIEIKGNKSIGLSTITAK